MSRSRKRGLDLDSRPQPPIGCQGVGGLFRSGESGLRHIVGGVGLSETDCSRHEESPLGKGVYNIAEVARYTELHPNRVGSWFKQRSDGAGKGPIFASDYAAVGNDYAVSFLDLIDVWVAGYLRDQGVLMRIVRNAHKILQDKLGTHHPFCHRDLYTDGKKVFLYAANKVGSETLTEIVSRQQFFLHVKQKLSHIRYGEVSGLAECWRIAKGVEINPRVALGKPVVAKTGVTTYVLTNQFIANNRDAALVAELFRVPEEGVHNAVAFEKQYGCLRAA